MTVTWTVNSTDTLDNTRINSTFAAEQLQQWNETRTGDLVLGPGNQLGWLRLPENSSIFAKVTDPSAGPSSAHFEFIPTVCVTIPLLSKIVLTLSTGQFRFVCCTFPRHRSLLHHVHESHFAGFPSVAFIHHSRISVISLWIPYHAY